MPLYNGILIKEDFRLYRGGTNGGRAYLEKIENSFFKVEIDLHGGTLGSVYDKQAGKELLWQGAADSWKNKDVVIFPFIARLENKTFAWEGREYTLDNHGLARYDDFEVFRRSPNSLVLLYESDAKTLARYPFEFALYVTYTLKLRSLSVAMRVENRGKTPMYFGAGFHPAYAVDCTRGTDSDDISGNTLVFDGKQKLTRYVLDENGAFIVGTEKCEMGELALSKRIFREAKTLIYGGVKGDITLYEKSGGGITYDMCGAPYIAVWSHESRGGYVCVEPWWGLPDFAGADKDISRKTGINKLEAQEVFECGYKVKYNFGGEDNDK